MIREILGLAHRFDAFLRSRFEAPYNALLGVGLVLEIGKELREWDHVGASAGGVVRSALAILLFAFLLLRQLGELYEHWERRAEKGRKSGRGR